MTKEEVQHIIDEYHNTGLFQEDLALLSPKERVGVMLKLMDFALPKPQAVAVDLHSSSARTIEDRLAVLAQEEETRNK